MSIKENWEKIKGLVQPEVLLSRNIFIALLLLFTALGAFALGRFSEIEASRKPVRITFPAIATSSAASSAILSLPKLKSTDSTHAASSKINLPSAPIPLMLGKYVGSKSGNKYHLPWCSGAKRILDENKVWFASKEEAVSKGYMPAGNCKGI